MKKLIIFILSCGCFAACNDNGGEGIAPQKRYRATNIEGHDSHWGDYNMRLVYHNAAIDSMVVTNSSGDRIAFAVASQDGDNLIYTYNDIVPNIDADSIAILVQKHGAEGAKEHIPTIDRTLRSVTLGYSKGNIVSQTFKFNRAPDDLGTGDEFDNRYMNHRRERYVYEYNENGDVLICRIFEDTYGQSEEDNDNFTRTVYKTQATYYGREVDGMVLYRGEEKYESPESYVLQDTFEYTFSGGELTRIFGATADLSYSNENGRPTGITANGKNTSYEYDSNGCVVKITYGNGDYMNITYSDGVGNYRLLSPILGESFNIPTIQ